MALNYTSKRAGHAGFARPEIGSITLSVIVALYVLFFTNHTFWTKIHTYLAAYPVAIFALYVALSALFMAIMIFFSAKYVMKPVLAVLIAIAATASWFMDRFGAVIDTDMVRNAFETTTAEAGNLITPGFVWHIFIFAIVPIIVLFCVRVRHRPIFGKLLWNTMSIVGCLLVVGVISAANSKIGRAHV